MGVVSIELMGDGTGRGEVMGEVIRGCLGRIGYDASRIVGRADSNISELIECSGEWKEGSRAARRTLSSGILVGGVWSFGCYQMMKTCLF